MNKEIYVRFMGRVSGRTTASLLRSLDGAMKNGVDRVHLMISSPGGSVFHALSLYNYLKGAPFETCTYNFGIVGSTAVTLYCAGNKRISAPHARIFLSNAELAIRDHTQYDEKRLEEILRGIKLDSLRIAKLVADTVGKPEAEVLTDMAKPTPMSAAEAKEYGVIHEIRQELFPKGIELQSIAEGPDRRDENHLPPAVSSSQD